MNDRLQRFQARARELAQSGTFKGWRALTFTLQFEEGFAEAIQWTYSASTQQELEGICEEARRRRAADRSKHPMSSSDDYRPSESVGTFRN